MFVFTLSFKAKKLEFVTFGKLHWNDTVKGCKCF